MNARVATDETTSELGHQSDLDVLRSYSASRVSRATDAQLVASAIDWIALAKDVATDLRESCGSEGDHERLAKRLERCLKRATDSLSEIRK